MIESEIRKEIGALAELTKFIDGFIAVEKLGDSLAMSLQLAAEEIFTNIVRHSQSNSTIVRLGLKSVENRIELTFVDFDTERFDPNEGIGDLEGKTLEERRQGGMGLFMVKQLVDEMRYDYSDRNSTITLIKYLEN